MLKQYQQIKAKNQDAILFFRLGDFYEMFLEDAKKASGILDLVLTSRDAGKAGRIPMCGIPFHAAEAYISKLIKAGLKVAICEQVEDPACAKGLLRRDVVKVITAGTYIDDASFETRYLLALSFTDKKCGIAFTDTTSGIIQTNEYLPGHSLTDAILKIPLYECVFPMCQQERVRALFNDPMLRSKNIILSPFEDWCFNTDIAAKTLQEHFSVHNLAGFGIEGMAASISASAALLEYLKQMHHQPVRHIHRIALYVQEKYCFISHAACLGLELEGLLQTIDHTMTNMGRRMLKDWIYHPLKSVGQIEERQSAVTILKDNSKLRQALGTVLHGIPDIEKSISRISCGAGSAKDLAALRLTLNKQPGIAELLKDLPEKTSSFV